MPLRRSSGHHYHHPGSDSSGVFHSYYCSSLTSEVIAPSSNLDNSMFRSLQESFKDLQERCSQIAYSLTDPVPTSTASSTRQPSEITPRTWPADDKFEGDRFILNRYPWAAYKVQAPGMQRVLEVAVLKEVIQYAEKPKGASSIDNEVYSAILRENHQFRALLLKCWEMGSFRDLRCTGTFVSAKYLVGVALALTTQTTEAFHAFSHSNDTALPMAAQFENWSAVKLLVEDPTTNVNFRGNFGHTTLLLATMSDHEPTVRQLLAHPAIDVDIPDKDGWTPLMAAALEGCTVALKLLLERRDIHVNAQQKAGLTALMAAVHKAHDSGIQLLLGHPATDVHVRDMDGRTALSFAAWSGREAAAKLLLKAGAEVDVRNNHGCTPLARAAQKGHESVVRLLLEHGGVNVNNADGDGDTPLICAADEGHTSVAKLLLEQPGIDVNIRDNKGCTALSRACDKDRIPNLDRVKEDDVAFEFVHLLLTREDLDINLADEEGHTPLYHATQSGYTSVVVLLRSKGAVMDQAA